MDGYVDDGVGGHTELRVHGVAGTAPEAMLVHPHVRRVAGDEDAGFFRRVWHGRPPDPEYGDGNGHRREAYSWGGLTSGASSRALWLLLVPFMLTNVAFWMTPGGYEGEARWRDRARDVNALLQRLFALVMTTLFAVSFVNVFGDVVAWQCGGAGVSCTNPPGAIGFLDWTLFEAPARRLALGMLLAAGVVALLWRQGRKSWNKYEQVATPRKEMREGTVDAFQTAIGNPRMWNGSGPVRRLRAVHVTVALATVGMLAAATLLEVEAAGRVAFQGAFSVFAALALISVAVLVVPDNFRRKVPDAPEQRDERTWAWLPVATLALLLVMLVVTVVVAPEGNEPTSPAFPAALPYVDGTVHWLLLALLTLLAVVSAVSFALARTDRPEHRAHRALFGLGTPTMLLLALVVGGGLAAALTLGTADALSTSIPSEASVGDGQVAVPGALLLAATGLVVFVVATAIVGAFAAVRVLRDRRAQLKLVRACYLGEQLPDDDRPRAPEQQQALRRARAIAKTWSWARIADHGAPLLGVLALVVALFAIVATVGSFVADDGTAWIWSRRPEVAAVGGWVVGLALVGLGWLAHAMYRRPALRRSVGIMWDIGTFWPRATHPLAPPCYCERAVPDLVQRVGRLAPARDDVVVLSAHSQGSVICAAVVLQLAPEIRARTALVTYGSPLHRLYAKFFPAYFGQDVFEAVGGALAAGTAGGCNPNAQRAVRDQQIAPGPARWPWRNLYRRSDPIGSFVLREVETTDARYADADGEFPADDLDWQLIDPMFRNPADPGVSPAAYGHSDYWTDRHFVRCIAHVTHLARTR